ncbi:hypothetical protein DFR50_1511, partial [Roseiarcus fermentans]
GHNADLLQLRAADYAYLTPAMTQAQDVAAVLGQSVGTANSVTVFDSVGDSLTLQGVTAATLAAQPNAVQFV